MQRTGFSLVELSIVLVILGLLTGGILAGQSLIRAAEMRSVTADAQRFTAAVYTFREKYFAQPGDMANATKFWGDNNTACPDAATPNGTPGVCNGNGDGLIDYYVAMTPEAPAEMFQAWAHLAYAGLIEGSYTGLAGPLSHNQAVLGSNQPRARLTNGGWGFIAYNSLNPTPASPDMFSNINYGNTIQVGSVNGIGNVGGKLLKPEEAWNLDMKMDDGHPAQGRVIGKFINNQCSTPNTGVVSQTNHDVRYNVSDSSVQCSLSFTRL